MEFDKIYKYYDLIYDDKDYNSEINHVIEIINQNNPGDNIIEYGSGTGKYTELFLKNGFEVLGVELSNEMHQIALSKGFNSINSNMTDFVSDNKFENAVSLFHVFSYLNSNSDINLFLKNLNQNLVKGGLFIFDAWYTESVNFLKPSIRTKKYSNEDISIERTSKPFDIPNKNSVRVDFKFKILEKKINKKSIIQESHLMRHFSLDEIKEFGISNGFKLLSSCELISRKLPSMETWSLLHTFKKI